MFLMNVQIATIKLACIIDYHKFLLSILHSHFKSNRSNLTIKRMKQMKKKEEVNKKRCYCII